MQSNKCQDIEYKSEFLASLLSYLCPPYMHTPIIPSPGIHCIPNDPS